MDLLNLYTIPCALGLLLSLVSTLFSFTCADRALELKDQGNALVFAAKGIVAAVFTGAWLVSLMLTLLASAEAAGR